MSNLKNPPSKQAACLLVFLFLALILADAWLLSYCQLDFDEKKEKASDLIRADMAYFPIPESIYDARRYTVTFGDSWMENRKFGGERSHEGCDIMAGYNKRGHYPVLSISDGTVEKIGWLKLGGYRIGIRSLSGVYFYYAHLSDYAPGLDVGDEVLAGEMIGFMGDTGYSETEGTVGYFPVHLHVGIYCKDENGKEASYNPYPFLKELETKKLRFYFE